MSTSRDKRVDRVCESRDKLAEVYELLCFFQDGWENDRALVLLKLNELNTRATQAEQRVLELEQVLREHARGALDDTCDDSDIVTCTSQHIGFNEVCITEGRRSTC